MMGLAGRCIFATAGIETVFYILPTRRPFVTEMPDFERHVIQERCSSGSAML